MMRSRQGRGIGNQVGLNEKRNREQLSIFQQLHQRAFSNHDCLVIEREISATDKRRSYPSPLSNYQVVLWHCSKMQQMRSSGAFRPSRPCYRRILLVAVTFVLIE